MPNRTDTRNIAPRQGVLPFWGYLASVSAIGFALLGWQISMLHASDLGAMGAGFEVAAGLVVLGELRPLVMSGSADGVNITTAFAFAMLLHWGLGVAVLMHAVATCLAELIRRKAWWRTAFNVAQYTISYAAADVVLHLFGNAASPTHPHVVDGGDLLSVFLAGAAYFVANDVLVARAVALRSREPFRAALVIDFGFNIASTGAFIGLAPIVVVVLAHGVALVPLLLLPLGAVYGTAAMSLERERQSLHDTLTGLGNRKLLVDQTNRAIAAAEVEGRQVALFLIDLDRFKEINDTLGHQVGDSLLQLVGERLNEAVRPEDTVGRLGGDEFALLISDLHQTRTAFEVADRVRAAMAEPVRHDGMTFEIEGSIGIALFPEHGTDFETLLKRADVAMYVAKDNGTAVQVYSADIDRHSPRRLGTLTELRAALDDGQLELHYQPKVELRTNEVVGVEALLRWEHPERGLVPPDEFLPLAEQTGLMRRITEYVVTAALAQAAQWWDEGLPLHVAVNVSARDLYDRGFAERLKDMLSRYDVPPYALMIEVTESVLMADPARAATTLTALANLGVGVSLDDFGTGYSSLVHLKRLPVSEVKIDRSFVMRMDVNDDDAAIVRSIIDLAGALGLRVVAEGVETSQAWDKLAVFGCDTAQGYHLSRALPPQRLADWLAGRRREVLPRPRPVLVDEQDSLLA